MTSCSIALHNRFQNALIKILFEVRYKEVWVGVVVVCVCNFVERVLVFFTKQIHSFWWGFVSVAPIEGQIFGLRRIMDCKKSTKDVVDAIYIWVAV